LLLCESRKAQFSDLADWVTAAVTCSEEPQKVSPQKSNLSRLSPNPKTAEKVPIFGILSRKTACFGLWIRAGQAKQESSLLCPKTLIPGVAGTLKRVFSGSN
jgi:hypothetical protein